MLSAAGCPLNSEPCHTHTRQGTLAARFLKRYPSVLGCSLLLQATGLEHKPG